MERSRHQILAGAGFACDQHRAIMRRHAADAGKHVPHAGAVADDAFELGAREQFVFELAGPLALARDFQQRTDLFPQRRDRNRLVQIIRRALLDRLDGGFGGIVRRHENHFRGRIERHNPIQHFHPGHSGHDQVRQYDLGMAGMNQIHALFGVRSGEDFEIGLCQGAGQHLQAAGIVVDNQQGQRGP